MKEDKPLTVAKPTANPRSDFPDGPCQRAPGRRRPVAIGFFLMGITLTLGIADALSDQTEPPAQSQPSKQGGSGAPISDIGRVQLPVVRGEHGGVAMIISMDDDATLGMVSTQNWVFFAGGAMSVPMALLSPFYALGLLYPVFGPPMNAAFESNRETLMRAIAAEPLPEAILRALTAQLDDAPVPAPVQVEVRIAGYGLTTRSGKRLEVMAAGEDLCVTAGARLIITRPGSNAREEQLLVGASGQGSELYPPICASPGRFAANEGIYLRQAVRELAEVLAAMVIRHLESPS